MNTFGDDDITSPRSSGLSKGASAGIGVGAVIGLICLCGLFVWSRCAPRGDKDEGTAHGAELCAQRDPVETQGYTGRQELSVGYQPPELMHIQGGKFVYSPKPAQLLGQGHEDGGGLLQGAGAIGVARAPGPTGTVQSDHHVHVHQQWLCTASIA